MTETGTRIEDAIDATRASLRRSIAQLEHELGALGSSPEHATRRARAAMLLGNFRDDLRACSLRWMGPSEVPSRPNVRADSRLELAGESRPRPARTRPPRRRQNDAQRVAS